MVGLTKQQFAAMSFIEEFVREHGFSPSYEEIGNALNLKSKSSVTYITNSLVERGYLRHMKQRSRSLQIIQHVTAPKHCPHCGGELNSPVPRSPRGMALDGKPSSPGPAVEGIHSTRAA